MVKTALLIGASHYQDDRLSQLNAPSADVKSLAKLLLDPKIGSFDSVITSLNESDAQVRRKIGAFFGKAEKDDLLFLFFAGHGVKDDAGLLYLAVSDTDTASHQLPVTSIPASFIYGQMNRSFAKRQVLVLDCCYSGAFARTLIRSGEEIVIGDYFPEMGSGHAIITSTNSLQYSWEGQVIEGEAENSVFTGILLRGLSTGEADRDLDGWVSVIDLRGYIQREFHKLQNKQQPRFWMLDDSGNIYISRNPKYEYIQQERKLDELYDNSLKAKQKENWTEALSFTQELESLAPGYKKIPQLKEEILRGLFSELRSKTKTALISGEVDTATTNVKAWRQYAPDATMVDYFENEIARLKEIKANTIENIKRGNLERLSSLIGEWKEIAPNDEQLPDIFYWCKQLENWHGNTYIWQRQGRIDLIRGYLVEWKQIAPEDPLLGQVYDQLEKLGQAKKYAQDSLRKGEVATAKEAVAIWQKISPDDTELGLVQNRIEELENAIILVKSALQDKSIGKVRRGLNIWERIAPEDPELSLHRDRFQFELASQEPLADREFVSGKDFYHMGRLTEAKQRLLTALQLDDQHLEARLLYADILFEQGNVKEAGELLKKAYAQSPNIVKGQYIHVLLTLAESLPENYQVEIFEQVLNMDPNQAEATAGIQTIRAAQHDRKLTSTLQKASQHESKEQWLSSIDIYEAWLAESPNEEIVLSRLRKAKVEEYLAKTYKTAEIALQSRDFAKAKELFEIVYQQRRDYKEIKRYLGILPKAESVEFLSSSNPLAPVQLLWWLIVSPQKIAFIQDLYGFEAITSSGRWLVSTLLWIPYLLLAVVFWKPKTDLLSPFFDTVPLGLVWLVAWFLMGAIGRIENKTVKVIEGIILFLLGVVLVYALMEFLGSICFDFPGSFVLYYLVVFLSSSVAEGIARELVVIEASDRLKTFFRRIIHHVPKENSQIEKRIYRGSLGVAGVFLSNVFLLIFFGPFVFLSIGFHLLGGNSSEIWIYVCICTTFLSMFLIIYLSNGALTLWAKIVDTISIAVETAFRTNKSLWLAGILFGVFLLQVLWGLHLVAVRASYPLLVK